jgi:hypothetical protein
MSIIRYQEHGLDLSCRVEDGQAWMTYDQVAELFEVESPAIIKHTQNILAEGELGMSTTSRLEVVQTEGNRKVTRMIFHVNQDMVLHIGYRVRSERGVDFRRWATSVLNGESAPLVQGPSSNPLVAQAEAALALTREFVRIQDEQEAIKLAQAQVEERVTQLEEHRQPDPEYFTVLAWAKLIGNAGLGRRASALSEKLGYYRYHSGPTLRYSSYIPQGHTRTNHGSNNMTNKTLVQLYFAYVMVSMITLSLIWFGIPKVNTQVLIVLGVLFLMGSGLLIFTVIKPPDH